MPVKLGILIKNLAEKAGVDLSKNDLKALIALENEVPDEAAQAMETGLFDLNSAKNNNELHKHFKSTVLSSVDKKIKYLAEKAGLTSEEITEIMAEPDSYKKMELFHDKAEASIKSKNSGTGDKKVLTDEISKLNADMLKLRNDSKAEIERIKKESEDAITEYAVESILGGKQYANSEIPSEVNVLTAKNLINRALADKKAKIVRVDGKLKLVNAENPSLDYLEKNSPVSFNDLSDKILADNKLLKINGDPNPKKTPVRTTSNGDGPKVDASNVSNFLREEARKMATA